MEIFRTRITAEPSCIRNYGSVDKGRDVSEERTWPWAGGSGFNQRVSLGDPGLLTGLLRTFGSAAS